MFGGISLERKFWLIDRYVKFVKFVKDKGMFPVNLLECRVRLCNDLKDPISGEIVPSKLFSERPNRFNDFSRNMEGGIVEFN